MRNYKKYVFPLVALVAGLLLGWLLFGRGGERQEEQLEQALEESGTVEVWTCSMHPSIRREEPGQCPICGMDLIPVADGGGSADMLGVRMTEDAMRLANVQTTVVSDRRGTKTLRLNGRVTADERNTYTQTTHVPGRVERLMVNFTGEQVKRGQPLAYLYSPDLVTAQEELLIAQKLQETQPALLEAAKAKLRSWKLSEGQVQRVLSSGKVSPNFPVTADVSGTVMEKKVSLGDYLQQGEVLYTITDLSKVWVLFELYESDLGWISEGDKISFTVAAIPGKTFEGTIDFIDPVIDPATRVTTARVTVENKHDRLKPEMFVTGQLTESREEGPAQLTVPRSAVLWTGDRSVVYVKSGDTGATAFELREVQLGPVLGDHYVILEGLASGEEIVTNGTFTVDAAAQLAGKPSMMSPEAGAVPSGHQHGTSPSEAGATPPAVIKLGQLGQRHMETLTKDYLRIKDALVADDLTLSKKYAETMLADLRRIEMSAFTDAAHAPWMKARPLLLQAAEDLTEAEDIKRGRNAFEVLSAATIALLETFVGAGQQLFVMHCPMAADSKGADWLSKDSRVRNPYMGQSMLKCGEVTDEMGKP